MGWQRSSVCPKGQTAGAQHPYTTEHQPLAGLAPACSVSPAVAGLGCVPLPPPDALLCPPCVLLLQLAPWLQGSAADCCLAVRR